MQDKIRACQWGAFDVANYGDRLFPLIANEQLTARLPNLELVCHAPVGFATLPPGSPPLVPLVPGGGSLDRERREYFARHFDAVLIGGGDLLRFDPSEPGYGAPGEDTPPHPYDAFLDFLWGECEVQPTILWNAPGAPFRFEPSRRLLVQRALSDVCYAAVRDEVSRGFLLEAGVEGPVEVVPDTGVLVAETIRRRVGEERGRALLEPRGSGSNGRGRLCFQCSPGFLRREEGLVAKSLTRIAARRNLEVVLLPIGWCHGDLDALRLVQEASGVRFTLVEGVDSPLEVGAVIGACDYFVGSSLHGNLTALSFGLPHIVVNNPLRAAKLEGFVQLAGLEDFRITDWEALEETFDRLAATPRERWSTAADRLKARASEHFDRLAELISRAAEGRAGLAKDRPAKPHKDIPFEVYSTIAVLHERLDDERAARRAAENGLHERLEDEKAARRATEKELRDSKEVLRDQHLAHKARLKCSEDRNERLETEVRTLRAQNESFEERLRGIESSVTWRLLGPYRRLRSVVNALMRPASDDGTRDDGTAGSR
jgi:Polysaccharide pyruvyl transferase